MALPRICTNCSLVIPGRYASVAMIDEWPASLEIGATHTEFTVVDIGTIEPHMADTYPSAQIDNRNRFWGNASQGDADKAARAFATQVKAITSFAKQAFAWKK